MLALERQRKILEIAKRDGAVRTQGLSVLLSATEEPMRRDLDSLARQGLLHRTHEGATKICIVTYAIGVVERLAVRNDIEVILLGRKTDHYFVRPDQIDLFVTDAAGADYCGRGNLKGIPCEVG
jgi:DeoR/GlpR family transcriptional regulator of sugar metabolism